MYEAYWGLERSPFDETHAPARFVDNPSLKIQRGKLRHAMLHGQGAAAILGAPGTGKTCLLRRLMHDLSAEGWACSLTVDPLGDPAEVLRSMAVRLGTEEGGAAETVLRRAIARHHAAGRRICLAVDEAHAISRDEMLEHLRVLLNLEMDDSRPVTLLLAGQEPLLPLLKSHSGFDQRLSLAVRVAPMSDEASKHYILARLKQAGCRRGIFTRSAAERIVELSGGIPRQINRLCELALVVGYGFELKKIRKDVIDTVAKDLDLLPEPEEESSAAWDESATPAPDPRAYVQVPGLRKAPEDIASLIAPEPLEGDILAETPSPGGSTALPPGDYAPPPSPEAVVPGQGGPGLFTAMAMDTGEDAGYQPRIAPPEPSPLDSPPPVVGAASPAPEGSPASPPSAPSVDEEDILAATASEASLPETGGAEEDILANL